MLAEVIRGQVIAEQIYFVLERCCNCNVPFFMPQYMRDRLVANPGEYFYCPNGHGQFYTGKTEAEKLKERLKIQEQESTKRETELENKWLDEMNERTKLEKKLKRVHNGICPCCKRSFANLKKHIATKHPETLNK